MPLARPLAFAIFGLATFLLLSCQSVSGPGSEHEDPDAIENARELLRQVEENSPAARPELYAEAARALYAAGDHEGAAHLARRVLDSPAAFKQLDPTTRFGLFEFLIAWLLDSDPEQALVWARLAEPQSPTDAARHRRWLSDAYALLGNPERAVQELHWSFQGAAELSEKQADRMWELVNRVAVFRQRELSSEESDSDLRAWWLLAQRMNGALTATTRWLAYERWKMQHPEHPAALREPRGVHSERSEPNKIGLILPLSGPLASAAVAIHNGFLFGHMNTLKEFPYESVQEILVYDSTIAPILSTIDRAIRDHVDHIVITPTKPQLEELLSIPVPVPVLALNRLQQTGTRIVNASTMVQFGVAIEDDAGSIAREISARELERIVVLQGIREWADRAVTALLADLPSSVTVVAHEKMGRIEQVTQMVGAAMGVEASQERHEAVQRAARSKLEFLPRVREDVDAIVAMVGSEEIESVLAALRFHFADELPLYVPAPAVRGRTPSALADGMRHTNLPLLLAPPPWMPELVKAFRPSAAALPFYALGIDAFRLANQWSRLLEGETFHGSVGLLQVSPENVVSRTPMWGVIAGGVAHPIR